MHSAFQADKVRVRFPLPAPLTSMKGPKMKLHIDEKDPAFADFLSQVLRLLAALTRRIGAGKQLPEELQEEEGK